MRRALRHTLLALLAVTACASDPSEAVQGELQAQALRANAAVVKIQRSLATGSASREFGEGVQSVEGATRVMADLESDPRASDAQRLLAVLQQARAWDDAARAIESAPPSPELSDAQQQVVAASLAEKAFPCRVAAKSSYEHALRTACRLHLEHHAMVLEIIDGIARYGGDAPAGDRICPVW